ncbi:MAG: hypothetical protein ACYCS7_16970 [Acidimicrobiales bacterium]
MIDGRGTMIETPEEWLASLFEYESCPECGGDAEEHVVCLVPGIGNFFARCRQPGGSPPYADIPASSGRPAPVVRHGGGLTLTC